MTVLLPTTTIAQGTSLLHVSRIAYAGSELYFGCAGNQAYPQAEIDGILYPSRNNYPGLCLALFDRCASKLGLVADIALDRHLHWPHFQRQYGIRVTPA